MLLRSGLAIAFARSPMVVANVGWDLQGYSGGRFQLGIGTQVKGHNERRFSVPWSPPAPRMREYVQALRAIWKCWATGEPLHYQGEHYRFTLMTPNFTPQRIEHPDIPVYVSALGPGMARVAGEVCDGLHGDICSAMMWGMGPSDPANEARTRNLIAILKGHVVI